MKPCNAEPSRSIRNEAGRKTEREKRGGNRPRDDEERWDLSHRKKRRGNLRGRSKKKKKKKSVHNGDEGYEKEADMSGETRLALGKVGKHLQAVWLNTSLFTGGSGGICGSMDVDSLTCINETAKLESTAGSIFSKCEMMPRLHTDCLKALCPKQCAFRANASSSAATLPCVLQLQMKFRCRFKVSDGCRCAQITSSTLSDRWRQQRRHGDGSEAERSRGKWSRDDGVEKKKKKKGDEGGGAGAGTTDGVWKEERRPGREDKVLTKSLFVSWRQWRVQRVISAHLTESAGDLYSNDSTQVTRVHDAGVLLVKYLQTLVFATLKSK